MARTTPAPPPPSEPLEDAPPASADTGPDVPPTGFFAWLRSLQLQRQPGWLGGVSAGIAARLGIDPLIVRGGFVVVALLGGPALLVYAAAWLLLPDTEGKIHLEQVTHGRFESPVAGIAALIAVSMLPVTQGFWFAGSTFWGDPVLPDAILRAVWTFLLLGALAWGIVWMVRRNQAAPGRPAAPTPNPASPPATNPTLAKAPLPTAATPAPPTAPAPNAPEAEFAAWRERQQQWKNDYDDYRHHNAEASLRAQELHRQHRLATAAVNAERLQAWRRANPRLRASIVVMILGAAIVAGAIASQVAPEGKGWVIGLGAATLVVGLAIMAAGLFRRRNGFLSFIAMVLLPATIVVAFIPTDREWLSPNYYSFDASESGRYFQPTGSIDISIEAPAENSVATTKVIDIWQGAGNLSIDLAPGASVQLVAEIRQGSVWHTTFEPVTIDPAVKKDYNEDGVADEYDDLNGDGVVNTKDAASYTSNNEAVTPTATRSPGPESWDTTFGVNTTGKPNVIVRLWQGAGEVSVQDQVPEGY